jgi:CBS domain containing-hemolysin-like protein
MNEGGGSPLLLALLVAAGALLSPLTLILSALLERSGPIRLRHWSAQAGGRLALLYDEPRRFEAFRFVLSLLSYALPVVWLLVLLWLEQPLGGGWVAAELLSFGLVAAVVVAAEVLNRWLVVTHSEEALTRLTWAFRLFRLLAAPVLAPIAALIPVGEHESGDEGDPEEASEGEIEAYLQVGAREGILEPGEETLIQRVIDFGDTRVKSVMTPRIDMVCGSNEASLEDLALLFLESNHSRIPLYAGSVDRIVGVLHIRDLLGALRAPQPVEPATLAMPAFFVPGTKRLRRLLREFQARRQQMAIVVDEYGGTSGLVTVEDLVEEIVGEIVDEHEEAEQPSERLPDGSWRIEGGADLDVLEELFQVDLSAVPYETVGGLIFDLVGSLPEPGAVVQSHGIRFTVEAVEDRRVKTLVASRLPGAA